MTEYQTHEAHVVRLETDIVRLRALNANLRKSLRATPQPARQALTDEQVWKSEEIMAVNAAVGLVMDDLMMLVRAIERAHGIGGEV